MKETSPDVKRESELSQSSDHAAFTNTSHRKQTRLDSGVETGYSFFDMTLVVDLFMMIDDSCPAGPLQGTLYLDAMWLRRK